MPAGQAPIFIIGSGAIGKTLAVLLQLSGRTTTLVRGSVDDGSTQHTPLRIQIPDGTTKEAVVETTNLSALPKLDGTIVLTNKSFGNHRLATLLAGKTGHSPVVFLQNGLDVERSFLNDHFPEVFRCVLFVTSQPVDETTIRFRPVAPCPIGVIKGDPGHLDSIVSILHTPDFPFVSATNIQTIIWKKAIINSVFNSVCPLLDIDNGIFHRDTTALDIARRIIKECIGIAGAAGIPLDAREVEESLLQISRSSDGQLISTLQDIRKGRPTEIETLNFEVVNIARRLGRENEVQETHLLGELTKLKADLNISPRVN
jgi:2-dehydropantoate 2-reductase